MTDQPDPPAPPGDLPFTIDLRRVHLTVGWIAFGLPLALLALTWLPQICFYASISHFYFSPLGGDLFVGLLSFIGLLLICLYSLEIPGCEGARAWTKFDVLAIRFAGLAALVVAFVPTRGSGCVFGEGAVPRAFVAQADGAEDFPFQADPPTTVGGSPSFDLWGTVLGLAQDRAPGLLDAIHYAAAGVMFAILAYVVLRVFTRDNSGAERGDRKDLRNRCYRLSGRIILGAVAVLAVKSGLEALLLSGSARESFLSVWNSLRLTFILEAAALIAFGFAWMVKGRFLPVFEDRLHPRAA